MGAHVIIDNVVLPTHAAAGEVVPIQVNLKNVSSATIIMQPTALAGSQEIQFALLGWTYAPGVTAGWSTSFTMPANAIDVIAFGFYYNPSTGAFELEDQKTYHVSLDTAPVYAGVFTKKVLEVYSAEYAFPALNIPPGSTCRVKTTIRNDMSAYKILLTSWTIRGANSQVIQQFSQSWDVAPGSMRDVDGPYFYPSVAGNYSIEMLLSADGNRLDSYSGALCTVGAAAPTTGLRSTSIDVVYDTYDFGATIPYVLGYDYKGEAQSGTLKIEIGTGVYPYFTPVAVIGPVSYSFAKKTDYTRVTESRTFILPSTLVRGQTYSARVILTTADSITDNDIDYTALKVLDTTVPSTDLQGLVITTAYRDYALGEVLPISLNFKYKGIAQSGTLQAIIGKGTVFTQVYAYSPVATQYDHADALTTVNRDITITLPKSLGADQVYSVKVLLTTSDGKTTSAVKGSAFKIPSTETPDPAVGEYREVKNYAYPYGTDYNGAASEATVEITVPLAQLPGTDWISQRVVDEFEKKVTEQGSHMLKLVVYERERGITSKDYKLIATATKPKEVAGQEYGPQGIVNLAYVTPQFNITIWALIVLGVLLALAFIVSAVVPSVRDVVWGKGGIISKIVDIGEIIPYMIIMMMMTLMMEQTRDMYEPPGTPPRPKPVTEVTVKGVKRLGRAVGEAAGGFGEEVGVGLGGAGELAGEGAERAGRLAGKATVWTAKKAGRAVGAGAEYLAEKVEEAARGREEAKWRREDEMRQREEEIKQREEEKRRKKEEAIAELRKRREEQAKKRAEQWS